MNEPALDLRDVSAGYGDTVVLEGLNLSVDPGESISIIGRNGVGKSSLLATVMGHTQLHCGSIRLHGQTLTRIKPHQRARAGLGYVPQERDVFGSLTVLENLAVAAQPGPWGAGRVLDMFPGLSERRKSRAAHLSGGEQQMLSIGRALMGNPSVLLMDEPSEGLAPVVVERLSESIAALRDEATLTIVLVEQRVDLALGFSPRCVVMERGRIVYDGTTDALKADAARMNTLVGLGAGIREGLSGDR